MTKIAIISRDQKISWKSCQVISANIKSVYEKLGTENRFFSFNENSNSYETYKVALSLIDYAPDIIVFMEHKPHPRKLLEYYVQENKGTKLPKLIFHLFGDFPLNAKDWFSLGKLLINFDTKFLCASDSQVRFINKFVNISEKLVYKLPFPVDTNFYNFSEEKRESARKKYKVGEEQLFLYTGRISHQKKVIELVNNFSSFLLSTKSDAKLYIAGDFDDLGIPYLEYEPCRNSYYMRYKRHFDKLPVEVKERITYVGNLNSDELLEVYSAADRFVSLSVHNDEDFGMSPAEALCCGLPSILTNWGGYSSFQLEEMKEACELIPVEIKDEKIEHNENIFIKKLMMSSFKEVTSDERIRIGQNYSSEFSIESIVAKLKVIIDDDFITFSGFNGTLEKLAKDQTLGSASFMRAAKNFSEYYKEVYESYVQK